MQTIFDHGEYQDILAVLKNKDERVKIQNQLLKTNPSMTVLAAKLNIPGPIKNNKKIESFFIAGLNEFEKMLLDAGIVFISRAMTFYFNVIIYFTHVRSQSDLRAIVLPYLNVN